MSLDMYIMTCIQHYSRNSDFFFFKQLSLVINSSFHNPLSANYYLLV